MTLTQIADGKSLHNEPMLAEVILKYSIHFGLNELWILFGWPEFQPTKLQWELKINEQFKRVREG